MSAFERRPVEQRLQLQALTHCAIIERGSSMRNGIDASRVLPRHGKV
jgi:hypothetical protein